MTNFQQSSKLKPNKKEIARLKNQALILKAAETIFANQGYEGASMNSIAVAAGVPKANVLYYFKSKDNLYETVLETILAEWNLGLTDISRDDDPAQALTSYIARKVRLACEQPMKSRLIANEMLRGAPFLSSHIREFTRPWFRGKVAVIEHWIESGKIQPINPEHLIFMIWASSQYYADYQTEILILQNKLEYEEQDIIEITQSLKQLVFAALGLSA
ncbi:TetR family transcriptional regulator C-terminal domain-containing protein [Gayadomonas joobiniege]|uniref:TetR family transcriptional regulator C-terminal domain-containing protein n=1 Tax=Gayadomonas joobiniege TaxID=1234606 RepID=UPI00037B30A9|nr:TetR family transcriptional regulator C-terminal domain-containing protein [Gayadomonas joobiniege]